MVDLAIRVEHLGKRYRIGGAQASYKRFSEVLVDTLVAPIRRFRQFGKPVPPREMIWALQDISFEVNKGDVIGIIGRNGAGKSTLLKVLGRITEPTTGSVEIEGRVGSLLEVGTGFHPELTGRENVYLNGAILGMTRSEIASKFDEIIAFAEIERFLDTPLKRYSSGMQIRLAFAVAAHLEPEILLVDEVLAVGDAAFQNKCLEKMGDFVKEGRTVLFVSHNMAAIEKLCESCLLLERGRIVTTGSTRAVINRYLSGVMPTIATTPLSDRTDRTGTGRLRLTSFHLEDMDGQLLSAVASGQDCTLVFGYRCAPDELPHDVIMSFTVSTLEGTCIFLHHNGLTGQQFKEIPPKGFFRCRIPRLPLVAGRYRLSLYVSSSDVAADWLNMAAFLDVVEGDYFGSGVQAPRTHGAILVDGTWALAEAPVADEDYDLVT